MPLAGYGFVLLAAGLWALIGPLARYCLAEGVTPLEIAFWRAAFGALFFGLHAARHGLWRAPARDAAAFAAFGLVGVALFFGSYQLAVREGGAALASILLYTAPAWVALLSRLCFAEPLTRAKLAALGLAMAGAFLICRSGGGLQGGASAAGIGFGLLAGFTYSLHYVFSRHFLRRHSPVTMYLFCLPVGALALLPFVDFAPKGPLAWSLLVLGMGLVTTYGAYLAYCEGMRRLSPTRVAVVANFEPVLAALLAYWLWDELFPPSGWVGAGLVIAAVFCVVLDGARGRDRHDGGVSRASGREDAAQTETAGEDTGLTRGHMPVE